MKTGIRFKSLLPHLVAVIVFTVISFLYFYPVIEGKILRANDAMVSLINSKEIIDYRAKTGQEPLWTNSIFSGMPAFLISTRYPGNLFKNVDTILRQYKMPVSVVFLSMLGFYVLLLMFGVNPWLGIVGGIAYGMSSFFLQIIAAGHNTQAIALAYLPPLIGSIWYAYRKDAIKGALLTAFFLTLEITANHVQMTYYGMICVLVFGIVELVWAVKNKTIPRFLKTTGILIIPFVIAVLINFGSLYTTWEYGKYSTRGKSELTSRNAPASSGLDKDYILSWSYGVGETFNMLIPNFKGGSSHPFDRESETFKALRQNNRADYINNMPQYWGAQPSTEGPHYVGAIVIFLFILGLILVKGPEKWWLLAATILSIMLAWGKNFMPLSNLFIDIFPGYNKFRSVTFILVIAEFCMPLLGFLALRDIFNRSVSKDEIMKSLKIAAGVTLGFLLIALVLPGIAGSFMSPYESTLLPDWIRNAIVSDRKELLRIDAFRSLFFVFMAAGLIFAFLREKLKMNTAIVILGILVLIDMWTVDKRYLNADRFERPRAINPTAVDQVIMKDKSYFRVLNMAASTFNDNSPTSYFHHSVGGYHGAKMERYQEFIDTVLYREMDLIAAGNNAKTLEEFLKVFDNTRGLNMLNCKYVIGNPDGLPLTNPKALGAAWFVSKPVIVANANEEISMLKKFDPTKEALVDKRFSDQVTAASYSHTQGDTIQLVSYQPNELKYKYSASGEKLAVFSEIYYPAGWKCFIDGKESRHFRTNYILRGMVVPAGQHEIRFSFEPASYITGNKVSLAGSVVLILLIAGYFGADYMKRSRENKTA